MMIARYGMLECGRNFKGSVKENCDQCDTTDNENHCLDYCIKLGALNFHDVDVIVNFDDIYDNDVFVT